MNKYVFAFCLAGLAGGAFAYTNPFTLDFNSSGGESDWNVLNSETIIFAETTPPSGSPFAPQSATGYNGTGWMRINSPQANGIGTAIYSGTAGGSTSDITNFTIEADVFVATSVTTRYQTGIIVSWDSGDSNNPFEFYYSNGTPGNPNGYGVRGSGDAVTTNYGLTFGNPSAPTESADRWVRLKVVVAGNTATVSVDRDIDGNYDLTQSGITFDGTAGKPGLFYVINDGSGGAALANQFGYYDNFHYTPSSGVSDWQLY
jgi:hypothetical protein